MGKPITFGEPLPTGAPCISKQYKLRTAALELYAAQAALGQTLAGNPTGTFAIFGSCLSCGDSTVDFLKRPNGAVLFSLSANNGKNLGDVSGQINLSGNVGIYTDAAADCSLTFTFTHATVTVKQKGDCGFGFGVRADGFYLKMSNAVPKIGR